MPFLTTSSVDLNAQREVDECYRKPAEWTHRSIVSAASMGKFSSDRSIKEYAEEIWKVKPCPVP
jgi:starch phosphorylase